MPQSRSNLVRERLGEMAVITWHTTGDVTKLTDTLSDLAMIPNDGLKMEQGGNAWYVMALTEHGFPC